MESELAVNSEYVPASFSQLDGWNETEAEAVAPVLGDSCQRFSRQSGMMEPELFGTYEQWQALCAQLAKVAPGSYQAFFENNFSLYQLSPKEKGLFTGYYLPVIPGSKERTEKFDTPLIGVPDDLIQVSLNNFNPELKGRIYGKLKKRLAGAV